jgi:hypothetical protein
MRARFAKKSSLIAGIAVAALALAPLIVPVFIPWSGINCQHQDINIKTGQARYSRYLWFFKVWEKTEETPLSATLRGETVDVADIEPWHRVCTFSAGGRHSPYYAFAHVFIQANRVGEILALLHRTPERQREIAKTILALWQRTGRDSEADEYIRKLTEERESQGQGEAGP